MSKICVICGKKPVYGHKIARSGLAKRKGGVGEHISGVRPRRFEPNLRHVKAILNGVVKTVRVCTRCLKAGKIRKAVSVKG